MLFEIQAGLDHHIIENKELEGEYLLDKKMLALRVELGELANELPEVFKYWSNKKNNYDNALEEYIDGLHLILSIGLELGIHHNDIVIENDLTGETTTETFNILYSYISTLRSYLDVNLPATITNKDVKCAFNELIECFVGLGEKDLRFTWEQIEKSYMLKNVENHKRQMQGY
ncbi:dUTPase [Gracilibacillus oryzae]|uniref:dUTPase n=2 Tax=Gracilibacillus oryzae TaxID=1672701 RepID=A0A7C8KSP2_9BACI|nr:dUTPase [Gracilibacillus oryzae]